MYPRGVGGNYGFCVAGEPAAEVVCGFYGHDVILVYVGTRDEERPVVQGLSGQNLDNNHLDALKELMKEGTGKKGLPNNQEYNQGGTLDKKPEIK